ncbi:MAG TPA: hypothetical protein VES19_15995 [Candidatus Limnocylindrales bacterium]|nr:hypothetical protein [Candidatus Limnocylindrales bacterium]
MPLSAIVWLGLLVALGVLFVITLRRMSAMIARTRNLERFQRGVDGIERRFGAFALPLAKALDATRRGPADPVALREQLGEAQDVLAVLRAELRDLPAPAALAPAATALEAELERATRAASLIEHGLGTLETASRGRDMEAQTSLKRGTLSLRHAHEAFTRVAREVARLQPPDLVSGTAVAAVGAAALATYPANDADDTEGRFDPRM